MTTENLTAPKGTVDDALGWWSLTEDDEDLVATLLLSQAYFMPIGSPDATLAVLATAASSEIHDEDPCWLMEVAPSSSGKGETIRIADGGVHRRVKDLTLPGLLSTHKQRGGGWVTNGLLAGIQGVSAVVS